MTMHDATRILYPVTATTAADGFFRSHELTTATHSELRLYMLYFAALDAGLDPLLEHRRGQSRLAVICSDEQWAAITGEGK